MSALLAGLEAGRELLAAPERWTQGAYARSAAGKPIGAFGPEPVCWCTHGAIQRVGPSLWTRVEMVEALSEALPPDEKNLVSYNDSHTHAEVLALWQRAIDAQKAGVAA